MIRVVRLAAQVAEAITVHVRACLPEEACGLLAVDPDVRIRFAYPLTNADHSPVAYTVEPVEHFGAVRHAERNGWEVAGSFHSHPTSSPEPSATDIARAPETRWIHLLAGFDGPDVVIRAYTIVAGAVREVPVEVTVDERGREPEDG